MCFAPQRGALFRHLNLQKWSEYGVFCTFWLGNVLRATMACNFSSLIWPAGSAPTVLASLLFDPPEPQISGIATFLPFRTLDPLSSEFFFFDLLSSPLFSDSSHLCCFSCVHIVGSLTSKLPPGIRFAIFDPTLGNSRSPMTWDLWSFCLRMSWETPSWGPCLHQGFA